MFTKKLGIEKPPLEAVIDDVCKQMLPLEADSDIFAKMNGQLEKLCTMKSLNKDVRVSPDAKLAVIGNLIGIVLILGYEHAHTITSKAMSFVIKSKA